MSKSYKLKGDNYIDSTGIVHNKTKLSDILTYSTEERRVGTWIDGKTIYRKVFNGSYKTNDILIGNVDTLVKAYGTVVISNHHRIIPFYTTYLSKRYEFTVDKNVYNNVICTAIAEDLNITATDCKIILEYTKTTD